MEEIGSLSALRKKQILRAKNLIEFLRVIQDILKN